ncbi:hypothetical protein PFISCL1PPCAC_25281, partial [Pristionchus fissidentatus]
IPVRYKMIRFNIVIAGMFFLGSSLITHFRGCDPNTNQCWVPASERAGHSFQIDKGTTDEGSVIVGAIIHLDLIIYAEMEKDVKNNNKLCGYFASSTFVLKKCEGEGVFILIKDKQDIVGMRVEHMNYLRDCASDNGKAFQGLEFDATRPMLVRSPMLNNMKADTHCVLGTLFRKGTRNHIVVYKSDIGLVEIDEGSFIVQQLSGFCMF